MLIFTSTNISENLPANCACNLHCLSRDLADAIQKCSAKVVVVPVTCVVRTQLAYQVQWVEASVFLNLLKG